MLEWLTNIADYGLQLHTLQHMVALTYIQVHFTTRVIIAVARNLCAGGKPEARRRRQSLGGSGGMLPQKMPFPEAISSSYLIQVMIFLTEIIRLHT